MLRTLCYDKAHELYGANLPKQVTERIEEELEYIEKNNFATIYLAAKAATDVEGLKKYQYFTRGVETNSFVAYLCGITGEINPLYPQYRTKEERIELPFGIFENRFNCRQLQFVIDKKKDILMFLDKLVEETGVEPDKISFEDKEVLELFCSGKSIGLTPEKMGGFPLGCLGIPYMDSAIAVDILLHMKPKSFIDMVRIRNLTFSFFVWQEYRKNLDWSSPVKLEDLITSREDIYYRLLALGLTKDVVMNIFEEMKEDRLTENNKHLLLQIGLTEKLIKMCKDYYVFPPEALGANYMNILWKIGYYKIHFPKAFYKVYFELFTDERFRERISDNENNVIYWLSYIGNESGIGVAGQDVGEAKLIRMVLEKYERERVRRYE